MKKAKSFVLSAILTGSFFWAACNPQAASDDTTSAPGEASASEASEEVEREEWLTDFEQAVALADEQEKTVFVNFTGSDWCPPCMILRREVFDTKAFNEYAAENLVLLEIDFPREKEQSPELVDQNQKLQEQFQIEAFPTLVLLNEEGEEMKRGGYRPGGPRVIIEWIEG